MKRMILLILYVAYTLNSPVFAQDVDLGLSGEASSLLNLPAPRGNVPAARGGAPAGRGAAPGTPVDRLVRLRELFAGANMPLAKEQEAALNSFLNAEIPAMRRTLQERIAAFGNLPSMGELAPEIIRLNDQLLGKMAIAQGLNPQQQAFTKKLYKDQVKSRGGFDAIKLTLEDAGAAFSPEQITQIQPLFDEQNRAKLQLLKETQDQPPEKAKIDQLQRDTLARVLKLLTPAQRTALLAK